MDHQDWNPVILRRSPRSTGQKTIVPKQNPENQRLAKIEASEAPIKHKVLSPESHAELVKKRVEAKLSQQQLNQQCSFPPHTIRDIEAKRRAPTGHELNTLNRILKCSLKLI
jgi:ribosome-binding protein aMBF1 (putative translation factor)